MGYGLVYQDVILIRIAVGKTGRTVIEVVTVQMQSISECLDFDFYDHVWWIDKKHPSITDNNIILGRWLRISHKIGSDRCCWVLTVLVKAISQTAVQNVILADLIDTDTKWWIDKFDEKLEKQLDDTNFVDDVGADFYIDDVDKADEAVHGYGSRTPIDEVYRDMMVEERSEKGKIDNVAYDKYIGTEFIIEVPGEVPRRETVIRHAEDLDGAKVGTYPHTQSLILRTTICNMLTGLMIATSSM